MQLAEEQKVRGEVEDLRRGWTRIPRRNGGRRNDPSVEGAYTLVNRDRMPPCRAMSRSLTLSAPASIPAAPAGGSISGRTVVG
jgi:hypothetical protein